jgi:hypothetical protein
MHRSTGSGAVADEEGYSQAEVVDEGRGKDEVGHESRSEPVYEPVYELDNEADRQVELPAGRSWSSDRAGNQGNTHQYLWEYMAIVMTQWDEHLAVTGV